MTTKRRRKMKRTFKEWETDMCDAIQHINDGRTNVVCSLFSRVWNHNSQLHDTWMKSMDGLNALERRLSGELHRARRKHDERECKRRHTCEKCGETVGTVWIDEDGTRLCTICAMEKCNTAYASPCCAYCGDAIDLRSDDACFDGDNHFCNSECALRYHDFERETVCKEDGR